MIKAALVVAFMIWSLPNSASAQKLPDRIRGYKVYETNILASNQPDGSADADTGGDITVKIDAPKLATMGTAGAAFEIGAQITANRHSGRVDRLTFHNVRVNGINVDVDEISTTFRFKKNEPVRLPALARVSLRLTSLPRAAYDQLFAVDKDLRISGTVFVFGKFKKFGIRHKRVVPIKLDLTVASPLAAMSR